MVSPTLADLSATLSPKARRPLGVWIFSVLHFIGAPIPLFGAAIALLMLLGGAEPPGLTLRYLLSVPYNAVLFPLTIGVFLGRDVFRRALLVLTTAYYGINMGLALLEAPQAEAVDQTLARLLGALLAMLIYLWYFRRPKTVAFFR